MEFEKLNESTMKQTADGMENKALGQTFSAEGNSMIAVQPNYRKTLFACYLGFITQAISANFTPLLFLTFKSTYGISLEKIALIPFVGILISVVFYAMGSGLIEVLVSPIVEACPFENKDGMMSLLHSFYCWGAVGVILGSTVFFAIFGVKNWRILTLLWALVPLVNTFNFMTCCL